MNIENNSITRIFGFQFGLIKDVDKTDDFDLDMRRLVADNSVCANFNPLTPELFGSDVHVEIRLGEDKLSGVCYFHESGDRLTGALYRSKADDIGFSIDILPV